MPCYTLYNRFAIIVNDIVKLKISLQKRKTRDSCLKRKVVPEREVCSGTNRKF